MNELHQLFYFVFTIGLWSMGLGSMLAFMMHDMFYAPIIIGGIGAVIQFYVRRRVRELD